MYTSILSPLKSKLSIYSLINLIMGNLYIQYLGTPHGTHTPPSVVKTVVTYTPIDYELGVHITL